MADRVPIPPIAVDLLAPWYDRALIEATPVLRRSLTGRLFGLGRTHAVTIDGTVHWTRNGPDDLASVAGTVLLGHELYHVMDQRQRGWWRYLAGYVWRWRPWHLGRPWEHPYEASAYERGREVRAAIEG